MSLVKKRTICGSIAQNYGLNIFLYTTFQETLEISEVLLSKVSKSKYNPLEYKHTARERLKDLLHNPYLSLVPENKAPPNALKVCANALIRYQLGINYNETRELKQAEEEFNLSIQLFNQLPQDIKLRHINALQDIFNRFGVMYCNKEEDRKAIAYFAKAEEMYNIVKDAQGLRIINLFTEFMKKTTGAPEQREYFGFYIDGGLDKVKLEVNYGKSLIFLAQAYGKLRKTEISVSYCAKSLNLQLEYGKFRIEDWTANCMSLASYFLGNNNFAQAEYCLWASTAVLSKGQNKKLGALVAMQMGKYYAQRLEYGIQQLKNGEVEIFRKEAIKKYIEFPSLSIPWPVIEDIKDLEKAKEFFRLANTQYKKALEYFVQENYFAEYVELRRGVSELYRILALIEPDPARLMAMLDRRREILESLSSQPNIETCGDQIKEIWYELSSVYAEMYTRALSNYKLRTNKGERKVLADVNKCALKSAEYSKKLITLLQSSKDQIDTISGILNQYMNIAKMYSGLELENVNENIKYYKESLAYYEKIKNAYENHKSRDSCAEEYKFSKEMCELLLIKIGRLEAQE